MSQALLPDRPEQVQPGAGGNAQTQAPTAGTDKAGGGRHAPLLPGSVCPCAPAVIEIRDLMRNLLKSIKSENVASVPPMTQWSRPMTLNDAADCYGVCDKTLRSWLALPGGNGIRPET